MPDLSPPGPDGFHRSRSGTPAELLARCTDIPGVDDRCTHRLPAVNDRRAGKFPLIQPTSGNFQHTECIVVTRGRTSTRMQYAEVNAIPMRLLPCSTLHLQAGYSAYRSIIVNMPPTSLACDQALSTEKCQDAFFDNLAWIVISLRIAG